ncbi:hypothetical protein GQ457_13G001680 [Hibiscus cannabinus]
MFNNGNNQTLAANHVSKSGEGQLGMDQMDVHLEKGIGASLSWAETETKKPEVGVGSTALEPIYGVGSKGPVFSDPNGIKVVNVSLGDSDIATPRAFDDVRDMGLFPNLKETVVNSVKGKSSWVEEVDKRMNVHSSIGDLDQRELENDRDQSEEESSGDFFPELSPKKRPKSVKRYGSLMDFQDKALTVWERKKRDKALKKNKLNKKDLMVSELSGRSLSYSDFAARWDAATREARKALKLGKRLGMKIVGDEQEVVKELARLEVAANGIRERDEFVSCKEVLDPYKLKECKGRILSRHGGFGLGPLSLLLLAIILGSLL